MGILNILFDKTKRKAYTIIDDEVDYQVLKFGDDPGIPDPISAWVDLVAKHVEIAKQNAAIGNDKAALEELRTAAGNIVNCFRTNVPPARDWSQVENEPLF